MSSVLHFGKESVKVSYKDEKIWAEGYDLEAERLALILSGGFGEGMNVALLALEECVADKDEDSFKKLVEGFNIDLKEILASPDALYEARTSTTFYAYIGYSPKEQSRWLAVRMGSFSPGRWAQFLKDPSQRVVLEAIVGASGPLSEILKFVESKDAKFRIMVCRNPHLPFSAKLRLANDEDKAVRKALASSKLLPAVLRDVIKANNAKQEARQLRLRADRLEARALKSQLKTQVLIEKMNSKDLAI